MGIHVDSTLFQLIRIPTRPVRSKTQRILDEVTPAIAHTDLGEILA